MDNSYRAESGVSSILQQAFTDRKGYLLLFVLWPFLALLFAIRDYGKRESKVVVYLFLIYYGFTFIIGSEGLDSAVYAAKLVDSAAHPMSDILKVVVGLYSTDSSLDVVIPFITFSISRFTVSHAYLFAAFAALFGYFYLKSIDLLHAQYIENPNNNALIHLAFFTFIIPIFFINGVRMWTAAWIFFYSAYHVVVNRDYKYILLAFSASLVHFSFLSASVILLVYAIAGNRNLIYVTLVVLSFILPGLLGPFIVRYAPLLGEGIQSSLAGYSSEGFIATTQEMREQSTWFMRLSQDFVMYYLCASVIIIRLLWGQMERPSIEKNLFSFCLLFFAFVNFGKVIPTFGNRFQLVFFLFATLYLFVYYIRRPEKNINLLVWFGLFPMILYVVIVLRQGAYTTSAWLISPFLGAPLIATDFSFYDLLFN